MDMSSRIVVLVALVIGIGGCGSSRDKEIQRILDSPVDYDSHLSAWVKMESYVTWSWVPMPKAVNVDPRASNPQLRGAIESAVASQMKVRGYTASSDAPDLYANYHVVTQQINKQYVQQMYNGSYWPQYRMDYEGSSKDRNQWEEGLLVIFLFDAKSEQMVWQGTATAEITDEAPEQKSVERLDTVIKTLFTSLPGRPSWQSNP